MIGTGVFTTSGLLVASLGSPGAVLAAWAGGGLLALTGALSYAELTASLPGNGGEYRLLGRIYHPAVGFAAGVISLVVGFAAPLAASALAFGSYLSAAVPGIPPGAAAAGVILVFAVAHGVDASFGGRAHTGLAAAQVVLILAVTGAGLALGEPARVLGMTTAPALRALASPQFAVALVLVSFAYSGWNGAVYLAGEVRTPSRTVPLALLTGTGLVTLLYLGLNAAFLASAPPDRLAGVVEIAHAAARNVAGAGAGRFVSGLVALTLASSISAMLMAGARVYDAMGADFRVLSFLSRRTARGAPAVAVAVEAALALAMIATSGFGALLSYVGFTLSLCAGLTVLGVFVLRHREPRLARPYRVFGYPLTPLLFLGLSAWMATQAIAERPASSVAGLATIALALLLYSLTVRGERSVPDAATSGLESP
jgi:APA family basic amino acid/polyamine antiporter